MKLMIREVDRQERFHQPKNKIQQKQNHLQELEKEFTNIKIEYNNCFASNL